MDRDEFIRKNVLVYGGILCVILGMIMLFFAGNTETLVTGMVLFAVGFLSVAFGFAARNKSA